MAQFEPKKSLGQHWLHDELVLNDIAGYADIHADEVVLEIGPGLGTLTKVLLEQAKQVVAVEFDHELAARLPQRIQDKHLIVEEADILSFDFTSLSSSYKLVANIPYYLTSNLIRVLSESANPPSIAVMLIQKEVAERVAAEPGDMSILSVTAQYFWEVDLGNIVPAELFTPPPKVDSQILILTLRTKPLFADVDEKQFFRIVKAGYSQRRKTVLNSLSGGLQLDKPAVKLWCESAGLDPGRRAQTLSLDEWYELYRTQPS